MMLSASLLDFYLKNNYNIIIEGRRGVGKTAIIQSAFKRAGLNSLTFSGATMDPWVDFVGVPQKVVTEDGLEVIRLIRPEALERNNIEAIFIDEWNRCLTGDTKIPLANGEMRAISELVGLDHFYVYSYNIKEQKVVIGRGHSARKTISNTTVVKITLDHGLVITCTPDHPFLLSDGTYKQASQLSPSDSLMPFYRSISIKKNLNLDGYETVFQPKTYQWEYTHRIADEYNKKIGKYKGFRGSVRHHVDFNPRNNSPENIVLMNWSEHRKLHQKTGSELGKRAHKKHPTLYQETIGKLSSRKKAIKASIKTRQTSKKYKKWRSRRSIEFFSYPENRRAQSERCKKGWKSGQFHFDQKKAHFKRNLTIARNFLNERFGSRRDIKEQEYIDEYKKYYRRGLWSIEKIKFHFGSFQKFLRTAIINHHIISVEVCKGKKDVYDFTVDDYHNFALGSGVFVHNSDKKVRNATLELIQFKSINGRKFEHLKVVWAAINPPQDGDEEYDVEPLDPAQIDRFHAYIKMKYDVSYPFFRQRFGDRGAAACDWWKALPVEMRNQLSPRHLEYAVDMVEKGGSEVELKYVIPKGCNVRSFLNSLGSPVDQRIQALFDKTNDEIKDFFVIDNNFQALSALILSDKKLRKKFVPLFPEERISQLIQANQIVRKEVVKLAPNNPRLKQIIENIINAKANSPLVGQLKRGLKSTEKKGALIFVNVNNDCPSFQNTISRNIDIHETLERLDCANPGDTTYRRHELYRQMYNNLRGQQNLDKETVLLALRMIEEKLMRSHKDKIDATMTSLVVIINLLLKRIDELQSGSGITRQIYVIRYPKIMAYGNFSKTPFYYMFE